MEIQIEIIKFLLKYKNQVIRKIHGEPHYNILFNGEVIEHKIDVAATLISLRNERKQIILKAA